jgi:hypothetical protein
MHESRVDNWGSSGLSPVLRLDRSTFGYDESPDRRPCSEPFHDVGHVRDLHLSINDVIGLEQHRRAIVAEIETSRLNAPGTFLSKPGRANRTLELREELERALGLAGRPRAAIRATIVTNQKIVLSNRHGSLYRDPRFRRQATGGTLRLRWDTPVP